MPQGKVMMETSDDRRGAEHAEIRSEVELFGLMQSHVEQELLNPNVDCKSGLIDPKETELLLSALKQSDPFELLSLWHLAQEPCSIE